MTQGNCSTNSSATLLSTTETRAGAARWTLIGASLCFIATLATLISFLKFAWFRDPKTQKRLLKMSAFNICILTLAIVEFFNSIMYLIVEIWVLTSGNGMCKGHSCDAMGFISSILMVGKVVPAFLFVSIPIGLGWRAARKLIVSLILFSFFLCCIYAVVALEGDLYFPSTPNRIFCWLEEREGTPSQMNAAYLMRTVAFSAVGIVVVLCGVTSTVYTVCRQRKKIKEKTQVLYYQLADPANELTSFSCLIMRCVLYICFFATVWVLLLIHVIHQRKNRTTKNLSYLMDFLTPSFGLFEMTIYWFTEDIWGLWWNGKQKNSVASLADLLYVGTDHCPATPLISERVSINDIDEQNAVNRRRMDTMEKDTGSGTSSLTSRQSSSPPSTQNVTKPLLFHSSRRPLDSTNA